MDVFMSAIVNGSYRSALNVFIALLVGRTNTARLRAYTEKTRHK